MKRKNVIIILGIILLISLSIGLLFLIKHINYTKTYDYRLLKIGYKKDDVKIIKKKLKNKQIDIILNKKYNKKIPALLEEKYFIFNNLDNYLSYIKNNKDKTTTDIVAIINVNADKEFYKDTKKTDESKEELMLLNKYNYLDENYNPNDLKEFSNKYAYGEHQKLKEVAYNAYISMFNKAKEDGYTLIVNSSYRSYKEQKEIYDKYVSWYGEDADKTAAKPGFSEHQTGLAVDIQSYCSQKKDFDKCEEFTWLQNNAYKYGFILRYPEGKEYITGYDYESWHYRYVGKDVAKYIQENKITFDEYYAYFVK